MFVVLHSRSPRHRPRPLQSRLHLAQPPLSDLTAADRTSLERQASGAHGPAALRSINPPPPPFSTSFLHRPSPELGHPFIHSYSCPSWLFITSSLHDIIPQHEHCLPTPTLLHYGCSTSSTSSMVDLGWHSWSHIHSLLSLSWSAPLPLLSLLLTLSALLTTGSPYINHRTNHLL